VQRECSADLRDVLNHHEDQPANQDDGNCAERARVVECLANGEDRRGEQPECDDSADEAAEHRDEGEEPEQLRRVRKADHAQQFTHVGLCLRLGQKLRANHPRHGCPHHPAHQRADGLAQQADHPEIDAGAKSGEQARSHDHEQGLAIGCRVRFDFFEGLDVQEQDAFHAVGERHLCSVYFEARINELSSRALHVSALIAAGGRGLRFGTAQPKQFLSLGGRSILERSVDAFRNCEVIDDLVVAVPPEVAANPPASLLSGQKPIEIVAGGARRQDSVANAFARVVDRADIVVIHDAARPFVTDDTIRRPVAAAVESGAAIAAIAAHDTVKRARANRVVTATLPREEIFLAQTPQAFRTSVLKDALALAADATDEAMLAEQAGHAVQIVEGDSRNLKITTPSDLTMAERLLGLSPPAAVMRIGNGYDLHRLVPERPLILGGVTIPFDKGLLGHSDADAICHAVTDAVLGAAGAGDIGRHFPDNDPAWKGANSLELLRKAMTIVSGAGFAVVNVDVVVIAQKPKLVPYVDAIRSNLAGALDCDVTQISVKGKTNEGVDSMGAGESIAVHAVALLNGVGSHFRRETE